MYCVYVYDAELPCDASSKIYLIALLSVVFRYFLGGGVLYPGRFRPLRSVMR